MNLFSVQPLQRPLLFNDKYGATLRYYFIHCQWSGHYCTYVFCSHNGVHLAILVATEFCYQMQGVKLSYKSYKILYFWNCPIKSYIFSKYPINPTFSTKTAIFVNSFKHFQGMGYVSQLYVRGMASLHLMYHPVHAE